MCRNPVKCGRCWEDGHQGNKCTKAGIVKGQPRKPINTLNMTLPPSQAEPSFDDLLTGPYPTSFPTLPDNTPDEIACFVERDEAYATEMTKLERGVIIRSENASLTIAEVALYAAETKVVSAQEITLAELPNHSLDRKSTRLNSSHAQ